MCNADPNTNPRPNRMIRWLKDEYDVTVIGRNIMQVENIENSLLIHPSGMFGTIKRGVNIFQKMKEVLSRLFMFLIKDYDGLVWASIGSPTELLSSLERTNFDLIITHDCTLLPLAFSIKKKSSKVMLDAREFYPRNFDDQLLWQITVKPLNEFLCEKYLPKCDKVITVSTGIAKEYKKVYKVDSEVIMSLPDSVMVEPSIMGDNIIRMIYHGNANSSRKTELMIEMMDHVDERFTLDFMLVVTDVAYRNKIVAMAEARKNVRVIPPVPMQDIVKAISIYDIGVFLVPPNNFNLKYTLPNKLFEFIQARLAVAIGPSIEMKRIVEQYQCGVISREFSPQSLANELNQLTI